MQENAKAIVASLIQGVENIQILSDGDVPVLYLVFNGYAVPAALAGDGIRLLLQIALELLTRQGGVVLLEEPEVHLHPGAIRQCALAILAAVRRGIQVVLTTHSLELIDALVSESSDVDLELISHFSLHGRAQGSLVADTNTGRSAMSELVILCEDHHDRAFWDGWLRYLGCTDPGAPPPGSNRAGV